MYVCMYVFYGVRLLSQCTRPTPKLAFANAIHARATDVAGEIIIMCLATYSHA